VRAPPRTPVLKRRGWNRRISDATRAIPVVRSPWPASVRGELPRCASGLPATTGWTMPAIQGWLAVVLSIPGRRALLASLETFATMPPGSVRTVPGAQSSPGSRWPSETSYTVVRDVTGSSSAWAPPAAALAILHPVALRAHEATSAVLYSAKGSSPRAFVGLLDLWSRRSEPSTSTGGLPPQCFPSAACDELRMTANPGLVGSDHDHHLAAPTVGRADSDQPDRGRAAQLHITTRTVVSILGSARPRCIPVIGSSRTYELWDHPYPARVADHLLFVLGLILIVRRRLAVGSTITASLRPGHSASPLRRVRRRLPIGVSGTPASTQALQSLSNRPLVWVEW